MRSVTLAVKAYKIQYFFLNLPMPIITGLYLGAHMFQLVPLLYIPISHSKEI